ncbi:hypothetical protein THRCLA_08109 [Thraustotheca clavata]|uniref:Secreted protein n=1 Tax=Thraustotheca clavata TaxID=74557 RepID=A0A0A7CMJ1_9STRA|nr:secreted protein [Thraustotheca clavata]OQR94737.1 hypothetical protein THRCLA_08109 [Thraustotheca clavata]
MKFVTAVVATLLLAVQVFAQTDEPTPVATNASSPSATTPAPTKCGLQFTSACKSSSDCGDLNGFNMTCIKSGRNMQCSFEGGKEVIQAKQNTSSDGGIIQFGDCSVSSCNGGHGFTANIVGSKCQEPLFCVREINDNPGVVLRSMCHTCGSCKAQSGGIRFDCAKICPVTVAPKTKAPTTKNSTTTSSSTSTSGSSSSTTSTSTRAPKTTAPATTEPASGAVTTFMCGVAFAVVALTQLC